MGATAGVTFARQPQTPVDRLGKRKLDDLIPRKIGRWEFWSNSGLVVPTEDALSSALYSQLLTRVYVKPDDLPIMLLVAQSAGQSGILQIHRPEFCYPAGGFDLSPILPLALSADGAELIVNELTATLPGRVERIVYWTRVGDSMPMTWAQQRLRIASDNLRGIIPDAVLIRVSTIDPDGPSAIARITSFAEEMLNAMASDRSVLVA
jgi:EpsI family protein